MEQREKLIWMLSLLMNPQEAFVPTTAADYLIEHGVVVLPCRCGECAFREDGNVLWCKRLKMGVSKDSYCSGGYLKGNITDLCTTGYLHLGYVEEKGGDE